MNKSQLITIALAASAILAGRVATATANCYTCTTEPPHFCIPAGLNQPGFTVCNNPDDPNDPCDVNFHDHCTGTGAPVAMLATRSLILHSSEAFDARLFGQAGSRILKDRAGCLAPAVTADARSPLTAKK